MLPSLADDGSRTSSHSPLVGIGVLYDQLLRWGFRPTLSARGYLAVCPAMSRLQFLRFRY